VPSHIKVADNSSKTLSPTSVSPGVFFLRLLTPFLTQDQGTCGKGKQGDSESGQGGGSSERLFSQDDPLPKSVLYAPQPSRDGFSSSDICSSVVEIRGIPRCHAFQQSMVLSDSPEFRRRLERYLKR
jgi:hypothetical protein